jgi:hypothetical protein
MTRDGEDVEDEADGEPNNACILSTPSMAPLVLLGPRRVLNSTMSDAVRERPWPHAVRVDLVQLGWGIGASLGINIDLW